MKTEVRTGNVNRAGEIRELGVPLFLGSESCPHLLPGAAELSSLDPDGVVLPLTPQRHLDGVLEVGRAAIELGLRISVNDAGILQALRDSGAENVSAGRGLVHGIEACPWIDDLLRGEDGRVRESLMQTTFDYSRNRRLFAGLGVTRIELDNLPGTLSRPRAWDVAVHADFVMVAYGLSCHTARYIGEQPPRCRERCGELYELELVDTFSLTDGMPTFDKPDERVVQAFPTLHIQGNGVYRRVEHVIAAEHNVIVDADFYKTGELPDVLERLENSVR